MSLVILGIGNLLMTDDGVGVHAARALAADPPSGTEVVEVGVAVFDALAVLERAPRVIVVDAVDAAAAPGTLLTFELDSDAQAPTPASLHAFDLPALVRSIPPHRRPRVTVVGLQPAVLEMGLELSPLAAARLPALIEAVRGLAREVGTVASG